MESGVHGVESEAAVCPGRRITGVSGSRWTSCGAGTGARDTLEGVAGITIPPEQPQSLPKALLRHPTVRYRARRPPRRSPGLAHFVILRPGLRQTPRAGIRGGPCADRGAHARGLDPGGIGRADEDDAVGGRAVGERSHTAVHADAGEGRASNGDSAANPVRQHPVGLERPHSGPQSGSGGGFHVRKSFHREPLAKSRGSDN